MFKANESDLMMRLLDPLFDMTWSWTQTFDVSKTLDKLKKISTNDAASSRKSVSNYSCSTVNTNTFDMSMSEKMGVFENNLKSVKKVFDDSFFQDLANSFSVTPSLYPGVKDVDFIARYLYREHDSYKTLLNPEDILKVTLFGILKHSFFGMIKYFMDDVRGTEAMKYIILPNKVSNATYDICRKRFSNMLVEETSIVSFALVRLARELKKQKLAAEVGTTKNGDTKVEAEAETKNETNIESRELCDSTSQTEETFQDENINANVPVQTSEIDNEDTRSKASRASKASKASVSTVGTVKTKTKTKQSTKAKVNNTVEADNNENDSLNAHINANNENTGQDSTTEETPTESVDVDLSIVKQESVDEKKLTVGDVVVEDLVEGEGEGEDSDVVVDEDTKDTSTHNNMKEDDNQEIKSTIPARHQRDIEEESVKSAKSAKSSKSTRSKRSKSSSRSGRGDIYQTPLGFALNATWLNSINPIWPSQAPIVAPSVRSYTQSLKSYHASSVASSSSDEDI
jgi:hypothetical protein